MFGHGTLRSPAIAGASLMVGVGLLTTPGRAAAQEPPILLDTLLVEVGSRASPALPVATRSIEVLDRRLLDAVPGSTVADALGWALGIDGLTRSRAQNDLAIRGSSFEQVLVLVDGVRMNDPQTGHFALNLTVPLGEVERIEILRGPASAQYGADAVGGVVNIVTRSGGRGLRAEVGHGRFRTNRFAAAAAVSGAGNGWGTRVASEQERSDGHRPGTAYRVQQASGTAYGPLAGGTLRAEFGAAVRDFGARAFYTDPDADWDEHEESRTLTASLGWAPPSPGRFAITPRFSVRRHEDEFILVRDNPSLYHNTHESVQVGGDLTARLRISRGLTLAAGAEVYRDRLESSRLGDHREYRTALFTEAAAGRVGRAVTSVGLRADRHSVYGDVVSPSLSAAIWPAERVRLRAAAGRAFRTPSWTERFYESPANVGDPDLPPERAWSAEIGADVWPEAYGARLGLTLFTRRASTLIDWVRDADAPANARWFARHVGPARFHGIELDAELPDLAGARWRLNLTGLDFQMGREDLASKHVFRPLSRTAALSAERTLGLGIAASGRLRHARRAGDSPHTLLDARFTFAAWHGLKFRLDLLNLLDSEYLDVTRMPAAGRAAYVGVIWR